MDRELSPKGYGLGDSPPVRYTAWIGWPSSFAGSNLRRIMSRTILASVSEFQEGRVTRATITRPSAEIMASTESLSLHHGVGRAGLWERWRVPFHRDRAGHGHPTGDIRHIT